MRLRRADGEYRWFLVRTVPLLDERGEIVKWYGTSTDIEDRKRAEEGLKATSEQLRALSARLRSAREEESTRIAREVHDEIGQALTALQMDVAWLGKRVGPSGASGSENLTSKLHSMAQLIDQTIVAVQRIATDLRPGVLDELGLEAAIEWHVREFENRTGIACRLRADLGTEPVDSERATAVFRILQEALTNVARHSGSLHVEIHLIADKNGLHLKIEDDGRGLTEDRLEVVQSPGLLGMRERARSLGGDLSIGRASPSGTVITLTIPP
jgi:signal transduction histidine kinase